MARSERFNVELTATDAASQVIDQVAEATDKLADGAVVDITAEDEASEVIEEVSGEVEDLDGATAETELSADDQASDVVEEVTGELEDLDGTTADAELTATDDASDTIEGVATAVTDLDGDTASVDLSVTGDDASDVTAMTDALDDLDGSSASASMDVTGDTEADGAIGGIMDNLGLLAFGGIAGAAAGALTSVFTGAADNVLAVQNMADATGSTLKMATGVVEQFDFVGVSAEKLEGMVGKVNGVLEKSPEIAGRLGITIGENQTPLDTFVAVVDALNSGQFTANERLSLATEIFGRKGALSVLAVGTQVGNVSQAIEDMPEWQVVTQQDVDAAIGFKQTMDDLGDQVGEVAQQLLTGFGPAISSFFNTFKDIGGAVNWVFALGQETSKGRVWDWIEAFPTDEFNAINDQLDAAGVSVESLRDNYFHLAEVQALLDAGVPPELIATADLTSQAVKFLGEQMSETGGTARALNAAFDDNAVSQQEWQDITADGVITMGEVEAAVNDTDVALAEGITSVNNYAAAYEDSVAAIEEHKAALQGDIDAIDEHIDKLEEQAEAIAGGGDAYLDLNKAQRDALNTLDDYHESLVVAKDDTRSSERILRDQQDALDDVVRAYDKVADATVDAADQQAAANGTTLTAIQRTDLHNAKLLEQAGTLQGPEKQALLEHTLRINGIPESRITKIFTDNDPNDLAQVERELANASRSRQALIQARIDQAAAAQAAYELRVLTTPRSVLVTPIIQTTSGGVNVQANATGDPYTAAGLSLVGEQGPELVQYAGSAALVGTQGPEVVDLPLGAQITPAGPTDELLRNRGRGDTYNSWTTVHMPAGTASSTVNQLRRYARRNGTLVESAS
jgi:hypothetical protein